MGEHLLWKMQRLRDDQARGDQNAQQSCQLTLSATTAFSQSRADGMCCRCVERVRPARL